MEGWMTVGPTDEGGFVMEVDRADGLTIKATVRLENGRPRCRVLELQSTGPSIDRDLLHALGLATLLRRAAGASGTPTALDKELGLTDEFLALVAATYRQALTARPRETTVSAVRKLGSNRLEQDYRDAPVSTARRWIQAARQRGFLMKTVKGRKGG
jgi:hypothetical protein